MSTKHTPGPWQTARYNYDHATVEVETVRRGTDLPDQGDFIALVGAYGDGPGPDAQLIAAAPDLLAALVGLADYCNGRIGANPYSVPEFRSACEAAKKAVGSDCDWVDGIDRARAAIAKAEGKDNEESF